MRGPTLAKIRRFKLANSVDLRVDGDALVLRKLKAAPRSGWAEASIKLAALGDDALVLPEFANEKDEKLAW